MIHDLNHTGIADLTTNKPINIYPNPANEYIVIENIASNSSFEIIDIAGKTIILNKISDNIDLSILQSGVYCIKITDGLKSYFSKLIKL